MADAIETHFAEDKNLAAKGIAPNVDFYSGTVYYQLGVPIDMFTPIFAMSRVGGWIGHTLEYQSDNRLIRPRARYTGQTNLEFPSLDER
jgi:citrate synthase